MPIGRCQRCDCKIRKSVNWRLCKDCRRKNQNLVDAAELRLDSGSLGNGSRIIRRKYTDVYHGKHPKFSNI